MMSESKLANILNSSKRHIGTIRRLLVVFLELYQRAGWPSVVDISQKEYAIPILQPTRLSWIYRHQNILKERTNTNSRSFSALIPGSSIEIPKYSVKIAIASNLIAGCRKTPQGSTHSWSTWVSYVIALILALTRLSVGGRIQPMPWTKPCAIRTLKTSDNIDSGLRYWANWPY
jgi:hypothetical protein